MRSLAWVMKSFLILLNSANVAFAFFPCHFPFHHPSRLPHRNWSVKTLTTKLRMTDPVSLALESSSLLSAVEVFHPSNIDPVVVSTVYWSNLQAKILTLLGVQFVAIIVGTVLLGYVANQLLGLVSDVDGDDSNLQRSPISIKAPSRM